jgi:hypothetical protein
VKLKLWGREKPPELAQDWIAGLPFDATFPDGWLFEHPAGYGKEALFAAVDPVVSDPNYRTTFLLQSYGPADDPDAFLDEQEAEFRTGSAADGSTDSIEMSRVDLQPGKALRVLIVDEHQALIQYYLPTRQGTFGLWFTTPSHELNTHLAALDSIAQSFRLREQQPK